MKKQAVGLQEGIQSQMGLECSIGTAGIGVLDIYLDGQKILSKKTLGRVPYIEEVLRALHDHLDRPSG